MSQIPCIAANGNLTLVGREKFDGLIARHSKPKLTPVAGEGGTAAAVAYLCDLVPTGSKGPKLVELAAREIAFTIVTSVAALTKTYALGADGRLVKSEEPKLYKGTATRVRLTAPQTKC